MSFGQRRRGIEPVAHDAILVFENVPMLAPGQQGFARAWVLMPDGFHHRSPSGPSSRS